MKRLIAIVGFCLCCVSCFSTRSITLPLGYRHVGVRAVVVRALESEQYTDLLAEKCVRDEVARFSGLFVEVDDVNQADVEIVVDGSEQLSLRTSGSGLAIGTGKIALGGGASKSYEKPATHLTISMYTREEGLIYQNSRLILKNPNSGMKPAARWLLTEYAKGR